MASLSETLRELRRRSFVGRHRELAVFRQAMGTHGVIFVHGVGGVGKSALLDAFADIAAEHGVDPVRIDARHVAIGATALPVPADGPCPVVLIDTYELLEPIDGWMREEYLPSLPADCLVVLAGRRNPGPGWRADPAWRELTRIVQLDNLSPGDGVAYLRTQGIAEGLHSRLLKISGGHPLTLSMTVDAVRRGALPQTLGDLPDVVRTILAHLIDEAPSDRHRTALEVCAQAPVTTEGMLSSMVDGDAGDLFAWLRAQPFIEESRYGLHPHDVVRDALNADLRWRNPERFADLYRRKLAAVRDRVRTMTDERERLQLMAMTVVLNGARSQLAALGSLPPAMQSYADGLTDSDREPLLAMTGRWQGREQAELADYWMTHQPQAFRVFRTGNGEPHGYAARLDLTESDLGVDPGTDAMWQYASKHGPVRAGERVRAWRFFLDRERGQLPSPSLTLFLAWQMTDIILLGDDAAWSLVGAFADGPLWRPTMEFLDFWAADGADYTVGGSTFPVFAHDWRRTDAAEWADLLWARQLGSPARAAGQDLGETVLAKPEFDAAVRSALRGLHAPNALGSNPLLHSRSVRRHARAGHSPTHALREMLGEAIAALPPDPRELITRTFLEAPVAQDRVAAALHLSFNTYRRHRDKAVAQLTARLWKSESGQPS